MDRRSGQWIIPCIFLWLGFVCAISFMEAWLKFRAPHVTLVIGLSIGRLIFSALKNPPVYDNSKKAHGSIR